MTERTESQLVIIGGGAAGLMAACRAAELGIRAVVLERKHRVGTKILMCGRGKCNLTTDMSAEKMLDGFGSELRPFLQKAIGEFSPRDLQKWFKKNGLQLMKNDGGMVFPRSERAADVVHFFSDMLRNKSVPLCLNSPVESIVQAGGCFVVTTGSFTIKAVNVLIATGGVSYPKTGSVGDGQKIARAMKHKVRPYRPGLVGIDWKGPWWQSNRGKQFMKARVRVFDGDQLLGETSGLCECEKWGLAGRSIADATRLLSRAEAKNAAIEIMPAPNSTPVRVSPVKIRPLKEAMVTVGGVDLRDIDPQTMQSRKVPGIYFAGEVMDVDGPTGGYNLTAAFATARLAVAAVAG